MLSRPDYLQRLTVTVNRSPIVAILGPRQVGKTTLARLFTQERQATYFDLESQPDIRRLQNPELALGALTGIVVIDEIQVMPELFAVLKVLVDRKQSHAQFLILGSASPDIVKNVTETLAGRVEFIELAGFDLLFFHRGRRYGIEVKFNEAPSITRSMQTALVDLELHHLWVVYPGSHRYPVSDSISVLAIQDVISLPGRIGEIV